MNATRKVAGALLCALALGAQSAIAAGLYGYVANVDSNSVLVIDAANHAVIATVRVGASPFGVAATPDGRFVYVTNSGANSVSVINTVNNTVVATVPVGAVPLGIAVTPDSRFAYVLGAGDGNVYVIATATNTVTASAPVSTGMPSAIAFAPDGAAGYVANAGLNTVSVLDTATNGVTATAPVGEFPFDIAVAPDGRFAYTANLGAAADAVSVIDTATRTAIASIALDEGSQGIALAPDGRFAYVTHGDSGIVSVLDTATNTRVASVPVGLSPFRVAVSQDGQFAYVTNQGSANVSVIDAATNSVVATIPVGGTPQGVAFADLRPKDTTAPVTSAAAAPAANAAGWNHAPVSVTLNAADEQKGSGVQSIAYALTGATVGGGQAAGANLSFVVSAEGATSVAYHALDKAGNAEAAKSLVVRIDTVAPASTTTVTPPAGPDGSNTGPVTVSIAATDNGSGVQSISLSRGNGAEIFPGASAAIIVSTPGTTTLTYQATDVAGNVEPAKTLTVRIATPPSAALSAKVSVHPAVLWPPDRRFDSVHAHFKVANAVGGTKVKAIAVTTDEPVGLTAPDWIVKGSSVKLRAERDDRGNGRVYTITYTLVDEAGNTAQASDTVAVPKHLGWRWNRHYSRWDRD